MNAVTAQQFAGTFCGTGVFIGVFAGVVSAFMTQPYHDHLIHESRHTGLQHPERHS
jgi:hypothetical protein